LCTHAHAASPIAAAKPLIAAERDRPEAGGGSRAELFDVSRGEVALSVPATADLCRAAESWIADVRGLATSLHLLPKRGYIIRIRCRPPLETNISLFDGPITELYLMWDPSSKSAVSKLLLLELDGRPKVFLLGADIGPFMERWLREARR